MGLTRLRYGAAVRFLEAGGVLALLSMLPLATQWQMPEVIGHSMDVLEVLTIAPFTRYPVTMDELPTHRKGYIYTYTLE